MSPAGRSRMRRAATIAALGVLGIGTTTTSAWAKAPADPEARAFTQIAALQQIKKSLTKSELKMDSALAVELRLRQDKSAMKAAPRASTGVAVNKNGTTRVTIDATKVDAGLLGRLRGVGVGVRYPSPRTHTVLVDAPLSALKTIASWPDVKRVRVPSDAMTGRMISPAAAAKAAAESKDAKAARIEAAVRAAEMSAAGKAGKAGVQASGAAATAAAVNQGAVVSEGDRTHAADTARTRYKVTGVGVKACVLSDGVDSLDALVASGDLPPDVDVLPDQDGGGDEGTAMLEIIHDLAPSAKLGFATAFTSEESFADNILALRFDAHCDIIVDDVLYFHEDPFQDGLIAQSVNAVTADGAFYFSSAGNEGNIVDGTAGNYEGDFVDSGRGVAKFAGHAHDFDPGPGVQVFDPLSDFSDGLPVTLWWADPLGASSNDYDLYSFDSDGNVLEFSQAVQDGDDDPFERIDTSLFVPGQRLAVVKFSGADRYFQLSALRGRFADSADGLTAYSTPGVTRGHSAAAQAFSVAATPAHDPLPFDIEPGDPPNPAGPYPEVFTRRSALERFTSDGPRRVFYEADGTPITPGDFSSTGGAVRQKPEITAADGTASALFSFDPFFGTSAAAPHAAAIAALALSGNPGLSNAELRAALTGSALDLKPAGVDNRSGYGVIRADRLLRTTGATPQPLVQAGTPTVTPTTGDGDAFLEPGEKATISLPAVNVGDGTATGVSVVLTSTDPLATVTPPSRSYGKIAAGASKSRNFTLSLASGYPVGKPVKLSAKVTFAGVLSPTRDTVSVPVGQPSTQVQTFAYAGDPVPIPDADLTGISATIDVSGVGFASGLTFSIDGTECSSASGATTVGLDHTFVGDLVGTLTAPDGTTATLFSRSGGSGNNFCQTVFDDAATTPFDDVSSSDNPFTGSWQPLTPLGALRGSSADGTWTFHVVDAAGFDTGTIRAFSLHITGFEPAP